MKNNSNSYSSKENNKPRKLKNKSNQRRKNKQSDFKYNNGILIKNYQTLIIHIIKRVGECLEKDNNLHISFNKLLLLIIFYVSYYTFKYISTLWFSSPPFFPQSKSSSFYHFYGIIAVLTLISLYDYPRRFIWNLLKQMMVSLNMMKMVG